MKNSKKLAVTLVKSPIGRKPAHRATVLGLGLKRLHQTVHLDDNANVRGMIDKISYLLSVKDN